MTPHDLIARFDELAEAPNGIELLRSLVLDMAVRGALVPQAATADVRVESDEGCPRGWAIRSVRDVFSEIITGPFGTSLKAADYVLGGIPVVNPQNLQQGLIVPTQDTCVGTDTLERLSTFQLRAGDIVVARRGEMGRCAVVTRAQDGWLCGTGSLILRPPTNVDSEFVAIFLRCPSTVRRLIGDSVGATMHNLNQRILLALTFPVPPLAEQKRIVARVDELMKLIDQLDAARTRREQARVAFRDSALSALQTATTTEEAELAWARVRERFDDVSSAGADMERLRAVVMRLAVRGALSTTDDRDPAAVVPRQAEPEYELPANWGWAPLTRLFKCRLGKMLDKAKNSGVARPYLRNANVRWWSFELSDVLEMRIEDDEVDDVSVCRGDLVICEGGEPGRCAVWGGDAPFVVQKALHRARPGPGVDPHFYALHLRADASDGRLERLFTGATIKHLTGQALDKHFVAVPPLAEQKRIVARVNDLMKLIDDVEREQRKRDDLHRTFAAAAVHHLDA